MYDPPPAGGGFAEDDDGLLGWDHDDDDFPCLLDWYAIYMPSPPAPPRSNPDRFSYKNIRYLRETTTD